ILLIRSDDGGTTWSPPHSVNPTDPTSPRHGNPAITADDQGMDVHISYYTQHSDGTLDLDLAQSRDGGRTFASSEIMRVTTGPSQLAPTNNPLGTPDSLVTANYNTFVACYSLGEYNGLLRFD